MQVSLSQNKCYFGEFTKNNLTPNKTSEGVSYRRAPSHSCPCLGRLMEKVYQCTGWVKISTQNPSENALFISRKTLVNWIDTHKQYASAHESEVSALVKNKQFEQAIELICNDYKIAIEKQKVSRECLDKIETCIKAHGAKVLLAPVSPFHWIGEDAQIQSLGLYMVKKGHEMLLNAPSNEACDFDAEFISVDFRFSTPDGDMRISGEVERKALEKVARENDLIIVSSYVPGARYQIAHTPIYSFMGKQEVMDRLSGLTRDELDQKAFVYCVSNDDFQENVSEYASKCTTHNLYMDTIKARIEQLKNEAAAKIAAESQAGCLTLVAPQPDNVFGDLEEHFGEVKFDGQSNAYVYETTTGQPTVQEGVAPLSESDVKTV